MKNKHLILVIIIGVILILYGLFSCYIAFDTIYQLNKEGSDHTSTDELITVLGEYYDM